MGEATAGLLQHLEMDYGGGNGGGTTAMTPTALASSSSCDILIQDQP
jgi:hypothetical protein